MEELLKEIQQLRQEIQELKQIKGDAEITKAAFTAKETATMLGVSDRQIYTLVATKQLKGIRIGHHLRIPKVYIEEFLRG